MNIGAAAFKYLLTVCLDAGLIMECPDKAWCSSLERGL